MLRFFFNLFFNCYLKTNSKIMQHSTEKNLRILTKYIIPTLNVSKDKEWITYADEADVLNVALFGCTAKQWRESNPQLALEGKNMRDLASINQLTVLSNLEAINSELIKNKLSKTQRFQYFCGK